MSRKSTETLSPAFYDICLNGKFIRDEESSEMLDIIFNSFIIDNANFFGWGGLYDSINSALTSGKPVASTIEKATEKTEKAIQKSIDKIMENG